MEFDQLYKQIQQECDLRKRKENELYESGHLRGEQPLALALMSPTTFEDGIEVAVKIKENKRIILNLEKLAPEVRTRVLDFVSGAALMRDYSVRQMSTNAVILARGSDTFESLGDDLSDDLDSLY